MRLARYLRTYDPLTVYSEGLAYRPFLTPIMEDYASRGHQVAYVTSEKADRELGWDSQNITNFHIGFGVRRTWFFQTLKARVLLLTMPDLDTFHIKRSVNPVHYVYTPHSLSSLHMVYREGAHDAYDTLFAAGPHHVDEAKALEKLRGSRTKTIVHQGYVVLDEQIKKARSHQEHQTNADKDLKNDNPTSVLVAPSWGPEGLIENYGSELVRILVDAGFRVLFRPHIRTVQLAEQTVKRILDEFASYENFVYDSQAESFDSFNEADIMVSAWSGVAFEFAFAQRKPVISIDVPKKNFNPNYMDIRISPLEIEIREKIGLVLAPKDLEKLPDAVFDLMANQVSWYASLQALAKEHVFNIGSSSRLAADHLEGLMFDFNQKSGMEELH